MPALTRAYCRCNSGHYFSGDSCPYDGWSSAESRELTQAVACLEKMGKELTIEELKKRGVKKGTLWRTIIVSFGVGASVFEALAPDTYVVNDETKSPRELGPGFE